MFPNTNKLGCEGLKWLMSGDYFLSGGKVWIGINQLEMNLCPARKCPKEWIIWEFGLQPELTIQSSMRARNVVL